MESNTPAAPVAAEKAPSPAPPPASTIVASGTVTESNPPVVAKAPVNPKPEPEPVVVPDTKRVKDLEIKVSELEDALHKAKNPSTPVPNPKRSVTETMSKWLAGESLD